MPCPVSSGLLGRSMMEMEMDGDGWRRRKKTVKLLLSLIHSREGKNGVGVARVERVEVTKL